MFVVIIYVLKVGGGGGGGGKHDWEALRIKHYSGAPHPSHRPPNVKEEKGQL